MKNKAFYIAPACEQEALEPEKSVLSVSKTEGIDLPDIPEEDF
jgi:hypothetical protein